jgi:hypothetical protein
MLFYRISKLKQMKRIFLIASVAFAAVACNSTSGNAETSDDTVVISEVDTLPVAPAAPEFAEGDVIKKDGKLVVYTNGAWVPVEKDIVLDNGVTVKTSGEIVDKKGNKVVLEEGERVTKAGVFFDRAGAAIDNAWDATKRGVSNAADATGNAVEKAADATKDAAKDVGQAVKKGAQKVGDKAKEVKEDIEN